MSTITPSGFNVPTAGNQVRFSDIRNAFKGGGGIIRFSNYYRNAPLQYVRNITPLNNIPLYNTNSILKISNFYGLTYTYLQQNVPYTSSQYISSYVSNNTKTNKISVSFPSNYFSYYSSARITFTFQCTVANADVSLIVNGNNAIIYSEYNSKKTTSSTIRTFEYSITTSSQIRSDMYFEFQISATGFSISPIPTGYFSFNYNYYV